MDHLCSYSQHNGISECEPSMTFLFKLDLGVIVLVRILLLWIISQYKVSPNILWSIFLYNVSHFNMKYSILFSVQPTCIHGKRVKQKYNNQLASLHVMIIDSKNVMHCWQNVCNIKFSGNQCQVKCIDVHKHIRYQLPHQCVSLFKALTYPHANVHKTLQTHWR